MIFAKRYENLVFEHDSRNINDVICGDIDYKIRQRFVSIMADYSEPMELHPNRYDYCETVASDALIEACDKFNDIMDMPYIRFEYGMNPIPSLAAWCAAFIFSIAELQYDFICDKDKPSFSSSLNAFFEEYDLPWRMLDGKMIKIDAQQFECDLKAKALEQMHELKDAEPKFQSAYTELTAAIDALEKGDYQATISNAGKSYESVLKVILGVDTGNANDLTTQYMNRLLTVPDTMQASGFRTNVMMALPYIRNKSGSDHGAGAQEVVISKPMAKLAVNLAAALDTYLIEEYAARMTETEKSAE